VVFVDRFLVESLALFASTAYKFALYSDKSAVKLSLQSFQDSYYYTNAEVNRIPELKSYLQGERPDQSPLAVKVSTYINYYSSVARFVMLSLAIAAVAPR